VSAASFVRCCCWLIVVSVSVCIWYPRPVLVVSGVWNWRDKAPQRVAPDQCVTLPPADSRGYEGGCLFAHYFTQQYAREFPSASRSSSDARRAAEKISGRCHRKRISFPTFLRSFSAKILWQPPFKLTLSIQYFLLLLKFNLIWAIEFAYQLKS
jgi:hypothetical protein